MFIYLKDSQFRIPRNLPGKFKRLVCEAEKKIQADFIHAQL